MRIFLHYGVPMRVEFLCHQGSQSTAYLDPHALFAHGMNGIPTREILTCPCGEQAAVTFVPGSNGGVEVLTSNVSVKQGDAESERA